jgi:hypothetical protein
VAQPDLIEGLLNVFEVLNAFGDGDAAASVVDFVKFGHAMLLSER